MVHKGPLCVRTGTDGRGEQRRGKFSALPRPPLTFLGDWLLGRQAHGPRRQGQVLCARARKREPHRLGRRKPAHDRRGLRLSPPQGHQLPSKPCRLRLRRSCRQRPGKPGWDAPRALLALCFGSPTPFSTHGSFPPFAHLHFGMASKQMPVRVVTETAWHALFVRTMFIRPSDEKLGSHVPEFTIIHVPGLFLVVLSPSFPDAEGDLRLELEGEGRMVVGEGGAVCSDALGLLWFRHESLPCHGWHPHLHLHLHAHGPPSGCDWWHLLCVRANGIRPRCGWV